MAEFGLDTAWDAIPELDLPIFAHTFEPAEVRRTVKIYAVPETVSENHYYISETAGGEVEEVPPSLVRETHLLAHFVLTAGDETLLVYVHPEVLAA